IELWDNLAKIAEQYLKKGDTAYIEGKIRTEEWQDKEGNNRTTLRIRGTNLTLLGGRRNDGNENPTATPMERKQNVSPSNTISTHAPQPLPPAMVDNADDDLPF
ncbi:MAG: single-stranded DNA-binding protein, partial [Bacteroidota bacterium]